MEIYKYGRKWTKVEHPCPLTSTDWLVVTIGTKEDQVWFDDVSGLLTLRIQKNGHNEWYQCEYNF